MMLSFHWEACGAIQSLLYLSPFPVTSPSSAFCSSLCSNILTTGSHQCGGLVMAAECQVRRWTSLLHCSQPCSFKVHQDNEVRWKKSVAPAAAVSPARFPLAERSLILRLVSLVLSTEPPSIPFPFWLCGGTVELFFSTARSLPFRDPRCNSVMNHCFICHVKLQEDG